MRRLLNSLVLDGRLPPAGRKGNIIRMLLNIGIFSLKDPHEGLFKSNALCKEMLTEQMSKIVSMHATLYSKNMKCPDFFLGEITKLSRLFLSPFTDYHM